MSRNLTITAVPFGSITTSINMYVPQPYHHSCSFWIHSYINKHVCPATLPSQLFILDPLLHQYTCMPHTLTMTDSCSFWIHNYISIHVSPATLPSQLFLWFLYYIYIHVPHPYSYKCSFLTIITSYWYMVCIVTLPIQVLLFNRLLHQNTDMYVP